MNTINSSQNAMVIFQGERGESAVRFINSTLEFDNGNMYSNNQAI